MLVWLWYQGKQMDVAGFAMKDKLDRYFCNALSVLCTNGKIIKTALNAKHGT